MAGVATALGLSLLFFLVFESFVRPDVGAERLARSVVALELALGVFAVAAAAFSSRSLGERLGLGPGRLPARHVVFLAAGTLGLSLVLDAVLQASGLREHSVLPQVYEELHGIRGRTLLLALAGLALVPGVCEELLCRGLVQRGLVPRLGPAGGIVAAALVFGALHVEPVHALFATFLGLYLGTVAWLAGSVRAAIFCHAVNNAMAVLTAAWRVDDLGGWLLPVLVGGLAVSAAALYAANAARLRLVPGAGLGAGGAGLGGGVAGGAVVRLDGEPVAEGERAAQERAPEQ